MNSVQSLIKHSISISLLFFSALVSFAQVGGEDLEFVVNKPMVLVKITPSYDFLFRNIRTEMKLEIEDADPKKSYEFRLAGGDIEALDSIYHLSPVVPGEIFLHLYEKSGGKESLVFSKPFRVLPEPKPHIGNVGSDSVLMDLLLIPGKLVGKSDGVKGILNVLSFVANYSLDGEFKQVPVTGDKLPTEVRIDLQKLPSGSLLQYTEIRVKMTESFEAILQPYRVTLNAFDGTDVKDF